MKKVWWFVIFGVVVLLVALLIFVVGQYRKCSDLRGVMDIASFEEEKLGINEIFTWGSPIKIYGSSDKVFEAINGIPYGIAFSYTNRGNDSEVVRFDIEVRVVRGCSVSQNEAESYLFLDSKGSAELLTGEKHYGLIRADFPEGFDSCTIRYNLKVMGERSYNMTGAFDISNREGTYWDRLFC